MAFYFSKRKLRPKEEEEAGELNIVPYLDILMNLIIFMLLSMTGLAAFGILNVNAPSYGAAAAGGPTDAAKPNLLLSVSIAKGGFWVAATGAVLPGTVDPTIPVVPGQGTPTIAKKADGSYDYAALTLKMVEIKEALKADYPTESKIVLLAESEIPYEAIISTMDAVRESKKGMPKPDLYPDVTLGAF